MQGSRPGGCGKLSFLSTSSWSWGRERTDYLIPLHSPLVCPHFLLPPLPLTRPPWDMASGAAPRCLVVPLRSGTAESAAALLGGSAPARGSLNLFHSSVDSTAAGRGHGQKGSLRSFCGTHGDKMARTGRVLLPPLRDPGERPDTIWEDAGRAESTPSLDPEPKDDGMQSFGKETRPKIFFFPPLLLLCKFFLSNLKHVKYESGKRASTPRSLSAPPSAEPGLPWAKNLGQGWQPGPGGPGWDLGPGKGPSLRRAPAGGGKRAPGSCRGVPHDSRITNSPNPLCHSENLGACVRAAARSASP